MPTPKSSILEFLHFFVVELNSAILDIILQFLFWRFSKSSPSSPGIVPAKNEHFWGFSDLLKMHVTHGKTFPEQVNWVNVKRKHFSTTKMENLPYGRFVHW